MTERRINIVQGEFAVDGRPETVISTLLGSCIAACIYDPFAAVGGMNHYLLPGNEGNSKLSDHLGVHLMELLINGLIKKGATRENMRAKIFGGASTMKGLSDVGSKNIQFAKQFLRDENILLESENTGGLQGRRLQFWPVGGRARQMLISLPKDIPTLPESFSKKSQHAGDLDLF